jgi:hypothetical protein
VLRRRRFKDVISSQLDLFEREHDELLASLPAAERLYDTAERDEAEETYGDYLDEVGKAAAYLLELRDGYAGTLDFDTADGYRDEFDRAARKRFPRLAHELDEDY